MNVRNAVSVSIIDWEEEDMRILMFKCDKCGETSACKADHIRKHKCPTCNRHTMPYGEYNIAEEQVETETITWYADGKEYDKYTIDW